MALIGRLFVIAFAILLAIFAAGAAIVVAVLGPSWQAFSNDAGGPGGLWVAMFFATSFAGAVSLLPAVILVVLGEAFKVRSLLVHLFAGAALLLTGYYASGLAPPFYEQSIDHPPPLSRPAEIAASAGAVFGLAYWLIAGRNAGRWRER